eukprot:scaffold37213_cov43-Cyclotella_meneghiniana.AAC.3
MLEVQCSENAVQCVICPSRHLMGERCRSRLWGGGRRDGRSCGGFRWGGVRRSGGGLGRGCRFVGLMSW